MKCFLNRWTGLALAAGVGLALRADVASWVRFAESGTSVEQALYRLMALPGGDVLYRRPPTESRAEVEQLIAASPSQADLYSLRAQEAERQLDLAAAEADWKKYVELSADKKRANLDLSEFYHRQAKVSQELDALLAAAAAAPVEEVGKLYAQALTLCERQLLPPARVEAVYQNWKQRNPKAPEPYRGAVKHLTEARQFDRAAVWIAEYEKQFPGDPDFVVGARANVARAQGDEAAALAVYDRSFQPLWPASLIQQYFQLLRESRAARQFLAAARTKPAELHSAARVFHYYLQEGNPGAAQRALQDFRRRREAGPQWTAEELRTLALLWRDFAQNAEEAARYFYALYSLPGATPAQKEEALGSIAGLLLTQTPGPSGDLTFYKDIATADQGPGFLNGVLSLLLNSSEPAWQFRSQEEKAAPYFARARASELIGLFDRQFPQSTRRAGLHAGLIQAYGAHGDSDAVISAGRRFLTTFPQAAERTVVSLAVADAHARKNQVREELAVYDGLLVELGPRSAEYARVLDRYVSRLSALKRQTDALALMRREIDRNPKEAALYERLAGFLEQNKMTAGIEQVYRRAMAQFPDRAWHHKLARLYLRLKQNAQFGQLTNEIIKTFRGAELEKYFTDVVAGANLDAVLYRQVNLFAYQRFPHNPVFRRNLLSAYQRRGTADPAAYEALLRRHWHEDSALRAQFFARLQQTGKLNAELAALNPESNPAARHLQAEAQVWRSHFEEAAAPMAALYETAGGDVTLGKRTMDLHRSLGATEKALEYAKRLTTAEPRSWEAHTALGEISSDHEAFRRIAALEPGFADGYLESATLFWDYYEFDQALAMIESARKALKNPKLYAYEAGAIQENRNDYPKAIAEYLDADDERALRRLQRLAQRPALRQTIDDAAARMVAGDNPPAAAVTKRIALLESQSRKADIDALLNRLASGARNFGLLTLVEEEARRLSLTGAEANALRRQVELSSDPVDKLRLRIQLAHTLEGRREFSQAAREMDAVYRDSPLTVGVMRAAVDYYWRNENPGRALEILQAARTAAHPSRKPAITFEYARKATEAGRYGPAREALNELLSGDPYSAAYLGAMADTYAREGNREALKSFYQEKIAALGARVEQVAGLRRALAGVLAQSKDYSGAMDQYIEVLNRYPEDESLLLEIASFARRHEQKAKVLGHYEKTVAASPKDFRYHYVLARLRQEFEDYAGAIAAYAKAAEVRPDRTDLLQTRGELEARLLRFDEAAATFERVYELSYRNAAWMDRVAEMRARQGRAADAVAALRKAYVENRGESPLAYFQIAERLESWRLLKEAREFAERGVALAGPNLLSEYTSGAQTYARILTRQRQYASLKALDPAGQLLPDVAVVVASSFTPAEKQAFGTFLDSMGAEARIGMLADMPEWQAGRLYQQMMKQPGDLSLMYELMRVQHKRLAFGELGRQLEAYSRVHPNAEDRASILQAAASAFRSAGDETAELRVLAGAGETAERYLELAARRTPDALVRLAAEGAARNGATEAAIVSGKPDLALAAVRARGQGMPPVWTKAYTALVGVYYNLRTPAVDGAFRSALDSMRIGDRVGRPVEREQQLAGRDWFYYGARYGEYLDRQRRAEAADFLASELEYSPGQAEAYWRLADYFRSEGRWEQALADYDHALELDPRSYLAMNGRALTLWEQGKRDQAVTQWKAALPLYGDPAPLLEALAARGLLGQLRSEVERAVVAYLNRSGGYGAPRIFQALVSGSSPAEASGWVTAISSQVSDAEPLLSSLVEEAWLPAAQKDAAYQALMRKQKFPWMERWVDLLLESGQKDRARTAIASLTDAERAQSERWYTVTRLRLSPDAEIPAEPDVLREAAEGLRKSGDAPNARRLLRRAYEQDIAHGARDAATLLGYAELRLEEGDRAGALELTRRMVLTAEPAFSGYGPAAALLSRLGMKAESDQLLAEARKATPWLEAAAQDDPELPLRPFFEARKAGRHHLAAAAIDVLLGEGSPGPSERLAPQNSIPEYANGFLPGLALPAARKAAVAREWADSLSRVDRLPGAANAMAISQWLAPDPAKAALVEQWRKEVARQEENRSRAPKVDDHLNPGRPVRPMLAGGAQ